MRGRVHRAEDDERAALGEQRQHVTGRRAADRVDARDDRRAADDLARPGRASPSSSVATIALDALLAQLVDPGGAADESDDVDAAGGCELRDASARPRRWRRSGRSSRPRPGRGSPAALIALNGIETSCAAASSGMPSGTGMSPAACATMYSAHAPNVPPVATR